MSVSTNNFGQPARLAQYKPNRCWTHYFTKYKKITCFRTTIIQGWQGLAYMMLDLGFPITTAVQDAMDESKF